VALGILEPQVSRGTFVRSLTPVGSAVTGFLGAFDLTEVIGFRRALEAQAAREAASNRSDEDLAQLRAALDAVRRKAEDAQRSGGPGPVGFRPGRFHSAVFSAAGNRLYEALYGAVMEVLLRAQGDGLLVFGTSADERGQGHREVFEAIEARDAEAAELAMGRHIDVDLVLARQLPGS
jgi:DNA-binding FadR family transcriptional regulator